MLWVIIRRYEVLLGVTKTWHDIYYSVDESYFVEYIDSAFWAGFTMTSIGFGDIVPITNPEFIVSLIVMVIGASTYASIFATLVMIIEKRDEKMIEDERRL